MDKNNYRTIDEYIAAFPRDVRIKLEEMRSIIRKAAPDAEEMISYRIPTFRYHGNLVHFAAFKDHIGFYPTSSGVSKFEKELKGYGTAKGTIRFALDEKIPARLIRDIVRFRVGEVEKKLK